MTTANVPFKVGTELAMYYGRRIDSERESGVRVTWRDLSTLTLGGYAIETFLYGLRGMIDRLLHELAATVR